MSTNAQKEIKPLTLPEKNALEEFVTQVMHISCSVLIGAEETHKIEFAPRDVLELAKVLLVELGRDSRTAVIGEQARTTAAVPAVVSTPAPASQPQQRTFTPRKGGGQRFDGNAPATDAQKNFLLKLARLQGGGQDAEDWLAAYFHKPLSSVTKKEASAALDALAPKKVAVAA